MPTEKEPLFKILPDGSVTSDHWLLTIPEAPAAEGIAPACLRQQVLPS